MALNYSALCTILHNSNLEIHWSLAATLFFEKKIHSVHRYKPQEVRFWAARFFSGTKIRVSQGLAEYHSSPMHSAWLGHKNKNSWLVFLWHFCNVFDLNMKWGECGLHIVIENLWKLMFHWPMFHGFSTKSLQFCLFASMRVAFLQPHWALCTGTQ